MVQEAGRIRASERTPKGKGAAARRAANEANETLRRFGSCIVSGAGTKQEQQALTAFLLTSPDDTLVSGRAKKILRENCIYGTGADSTMLRFQPILLRGAVFRQLYLDLNTGSPSRVDHDALGRSAASNVSGSLAANQRFGDCLVSADPKAADDFVRAKVASAEQDAALQRVMARMSGCLAKGLTLQLSRAVLDGMLAEALFFKGVTPGLAAAGG